MPVGGLEPASRKGHRPPGPTEGQPLRPKGPHRQRGGRSQAGGGSGLVNVNGRLFAPLQGLNPNNILMGGYGWLSMTDGGATYHPGLDLNSGGGCNDDLGALVVAPLAGVVRAVLYAASGEGNHVWVELDDPCCPGPTYWHTDHLQSVSVSVGQRLAPGDPIGGCGATGGWDCAHAHTEFTKGPPQYGWWQWPYGWSRAQVEAAYYEPIVWWNAATALVLAEGNQPIPPEVVVMLSDWEMLNWVMPDLWQWAGVPYNPESLTSKAWLEELRQGRYRGRPRTDDRRYGEGDGRGHWAEFDLGVCVTRSDSGEWSWHG
jgi:hypothetical protein